MIGGWILLAVAAGLCWGSTLLNLPGWRSPGLWLGAVGAVVTAFGAAIYSRDQSPKLGFYVGAFYLVVAAFAVGFIFWSGIPKWVGIALLVAAIPVGVWASRLK